MARVAYPIQQGPVRKEYDLIPRPLRCVNAKQPVYHADLAADLASKPGRGDFDDIIEPAGERASLPLARPLCHGLGRRFPPKKKTPTAIPASIKRPNKTRAPEVLMAHHTLGE